MTITAEIPFSINGTHHGAVAIVEYNPLDSIDAVFITFPPNDNVWVFHIEFLMGSHNYGGDVSSVVTDNMVSISLHTDTGAVIMFDKIDIDMFLDEVADYLEEHDIVLEWQREVEVDLFLHSLL